AVTRPGRGARAVGRDARARLGSYRPPVRPGPDLGRVIGPIDEKGRSKADAATGSVARPGAGDEKR
ncbi:hypothetical protein C1I95_29425, partial [Micromonospora craterilacus]